MRKCKKCGGSKKAFLGTVLSVINTGLGIYNTIQGNKLKAQQERDAQYAANLNNINNFTQNQLQALTYSQGNDSYEQERNTLPTLSTKQTQMKCGGKKRVKRACGGIKKYI